MTRRQHQERELRLKAESERNAMETKYEELQDKYLSLEAIAMQSEAQWEQKCQDGLRDITELLQDVSRAYLMQYEYLRHRKSFSLVVRLPWRRLRKRIMAMECLEAICTEHELEFEKEKFFEYKDSTTQTKRKGAEIKSETVAMKVTKESAEIATNTDSPMATHREHRTKRTVDVGVNTMAGNRVTRATQANTTKSKAVDRSTQCLLLAPPASIVDEEESSVDLEDIFQNTICALPDMLGEIADLEVPKVSAASQTKKRTKTQETQTDLNNISRAIDYRPVAGKRYRAVDDVEPMKREWLSVDGDSNCRSLEQFEEYWSMAGRSLMNSLFELKPRSDMSAGLVGLECFQRQLLQEQMVAKFLSGTVPVKKAVSIPSVYAESTKSGYEREAVDEEEQEGEEERGEKRRRRSRRSRSIDQDESQSLPASIPEECPEIGERLAGFNNIDHPQAKDQPPLASQSAGIEGRRGEGVNSRSPRRITRRHPMIRRLPVNRTVDRILRARANIFRIREPGVVRRKSGGLKAAPREVQLKRIRLIKQQEERPRLDSGGSEMDENRLERIRDYFELPQLMDPILDGDLMAEGEDRIGELRNDLEITDSEESDREGVMEVMEEDSRVDSLPIDNREEEEEENRGQAEHPKLNESPSESSHVQPSHTTNVHTETSLHPIEYDSPASPPPSDCIQYPGHIPAKIHTESQECSNKSIDSSKSCVRRLKLTHTTLNQFIQNYTPLIKPVPPPKKFEVTVKEVLDCYLDSEWTSVAVAECADRLGEIIQEDKLGVVLVILNYMAPCTDDIVYEPLNSLAPFMPKTHQKVVQLVDRLGLGQRMIQEIEQRLFSFKPDSVPIRGIINYTYLYLTLQDLEMNKSREVACPLRLFLVKALYFLKNSSVVIVFMTLKAFPKLLPRIEREQSFVVGARSSDPLVDVLVCVLNNTRDELAAKVHTFKSQRPPTDVVIRNKYRYEWKKLQKCYYGYNNTEPRPEDVLAMLMERLRTPGKGLNVVHGILLLAKHMDVAWAQTEVLQKQVLPSVNAILATEERLSPEVEDHLCLYMTVIAGAVKVFPKKDDVSAYRSVFQRVLENKEQFSHRVQECAVVSILRLASFSVESAFNAIRDWYAPPETLSAHLRATLETFLSRQWAHYWVKLSNG